MYKYKKFYKTGLEKENAFADFLINNFGGSVEHTSREQDMFDHIDLIWVFNNKRYTFDVKGLKKHNQHDFRTDDSIHWIEVQNVRGNPGWIYGKATFIVFETNTEWIIVKRSVLPQWIDQKVINKTILKSKELYTYYQRYNRNDIVVKVLTKDLRKIAEKIINKI